MGNGRWNRRDLIRAGFYGGIGGALALEQLGGVPLLGQWMSSRIQNPATGPNPYDAYSLVQDALQGGASALRLHQAMAQDDDGWSIVHIKVLNHVSTPLVFKLGELTGETVTNNEPPVSDRGGQTTTMLQDLGADEISDMERYRALRFNRWFGGMLHHGTPDGLPLQNQDLRGITQDQVGPLDDQVAIQTFLGLGQITSNNHALLGCKMRESQPDISLYLQDTGLVDSPLGISCFMMGGQYDKAEGSLSRNAVLGPNEETEVISSRAVRDYVDQIDQFVGKSYADRSALDQNLVFELDKLVRKEPKLRRELMASLEQFKNGLSNLRSTAELETRRQTLDRSIGNVQSASASSEDAQGATSEFLAQCQYAARVLDFPGTPLRNFSMFLNINDLDRDNLDADKNKAANASSIQAYSYIEGMRQLAMGLNVLGNKIAQGKKLMVVVSSEGGRAADMSDSKTSFSLVLGPGGGGNLSDALYANQNAINQPSGGPVANPAAPNAAMPWDVDGLKEADGSASDGTPTTGDVQLGIVEFLEEKLNRATRTELKGPDGRYVKLKRS